MLPKEQTSLPITSIIQETRWLRTWFIGKKSICQGGILSLGREDPIEEEMATHSSILA